MSSKSHSFKNLSKSIEQMSTNLKSLEASNTVPLQDMFAPEFMRTYSSFEDFDSFVLASGLINGELTQQAFEAMPDEKWDTWVREETSFQSWPVMLDKASQEWLERKVFAGVK